MAEELRVALIEANIQRRVGRTRVVQDILRPSRPTKPQRDKLLAELKHEWPDSFACLVICLPDRNPIVTLKELLSDCLHRARQNKERPFIGECYVETPIATLFVGPRQPLSSAPDADRPGNP